MSTNAAARESALAALSDEELTDLWRRTMMGAANARARAAQRRRARRVLDAVLGEVAATASEQVWAEEIDEAHGRRFGIYY